MKFALNYSREAAALVQAGRIEVDYFKLPAWPATILEATGIMPAYIHFPLKAGLGIADVYNTETHQLADLDRVEELLNQTRTPYVNIHLSPTIYDHPDIPVTTSYPPHINMITDFLLQDVLALTHRFGPERVIVESVYSHGGQELQPAYLPEVINTVVEESGCGFLLDISHTRLAAQDLGMDARRYISSLPLHRLREVHVTGIQLFDEKWIQHHKIGSRNGSGTQRCHVTHPKGPNVVYFDPSWPLQPRTGTQKHRKC